jgi:DNA (cytosine-5)-methyltransferase 1
MTHGSLFSGIGGFDLAAEWMGWENIFHCEWNEFGKKVLHHYWPKAISYHDITKTDFTIHRGAIDILTGGFPCQPYSTAGKRKGKEDERHLWPEMLRAIKEIQPRWVVGENVYGLVNWSGGLVFHEVQADLEAAGYEVFPYVLPAVSVNAPHRRDRIWFVAHPNRNGLNGSDCQHEIQPSKGGEYAQCNFEQMGGDAADCESQSSGGELQQRQAQRESGGCDSKGDVADTDGIGLWEQSNRTGEPEFISENEPGNYWQNFPTQSPICTGDDGLSSQLDNITFSKWRNESIKAAGNAIVPQVALQIFKTIQQYETTPKLEDKI